MNEDDQSTEVTVTFKTDHPALQGHFPGNPVVPGVVILGEVLHALREEEGKWAVPYAAQTIKFHMPLRPDQKLRICLQPKDGECRTFSCYVDTTLIASGQFRSQQPNTKLRDGS